jgi:sugar O-acyltransferase (sialic acid O-acetyltransferase NeuD family)
MSEIILIGACGHAKAIIAAARQCGISVRAIYDDEPTHWGQSLLEVPIVGPVADAPSAQRPAVLAYDDPRKRKSIAATLDVPWTTVIHPSAFLNESASVGAGTVILEGVILQPSVIVGRHVLIAANATLSHDCVVEDGVLLSEGVDLAGGVHVAEGTVFGVGAVVIPNVHVGAWTTVGPRAAVIHDVPDHSRLEGVPARSVDLDSPSLGNDPWSDHEALLAVWIALCTTLIGLGCV